MNATQYDPGPAEAGAGELVPRATIEAIVKQRNTALALYGQAHTALMNASDASTAAHDASRKINPNADGHRFNHHLHHDKEAFMTVGKPQSRDDYMKVAARIVDTEAWSHIVAITDLERLMDKQAKGELYQSLLGNPPEATVENIRATLQQFILDADTIFQRGIANCFSKLERRFRSHDGFKIGSRVVLTGMYDGFGFRNSSRDMESTLLDIERTFMVLDGKAVPPGWSGINGKLSESRYTGKGPRQGEVEDEFFLVRVFKNGNCHVWFKRDDLLEKVNKLLAEYYGEVIPDGMVPEDDGGLFTPKTSLAKNYGFFPTPDKAAETVVEDALLYRHDPLAKRLTVLEPSAGGGALVRSPAPGSIVLRSNPRSSPRCAPKAFTLASTVPTSFRWSPAPSAFSTGW
jgi:hypothetical protein